MSYLAFVILMGLDDFKESGKVIIMTTNMSLKKYFKF